MRHMVRAVVTVLVVTSVASDTTAEESQAPPTVEFGAPQPPPEAEPEAQVAAPQPEADSQRQSPSTAPSGGTPWLTAGEVEAAGERGVLACENAVCRCERELEGSTECASVTCRCVDEVPAAGPFLPREVQQPSSGVTPGSGADVWTAAMEGRGLPTLLEEPVPAAGFNLSRYRLGFKIEAGYPFFDTELLVRLHNVVQLGFGYRSAYTMSNGGYADLSFRLYRNSDATRGISLLLRGGYNYVHPQEADNDIPAMLGGDAAFGEAILAASFRWGRHAFDLNVGVRLGWVKAQDCEEDDWGYTDCWYAIFSDGEPGLLATFIADFGYAVRIHPAVSYYFAFGVDVYTTSEQYPALPLFRNGIIIEF